MAGTLRLVFGSALDTKSGSLVVGLILVELLHGGLWSTRFRKGPSGHVRFVRGVGG